jgi:hypothetical protein
VLVGILFSQIVFQWALGSNGGILSPILFCIYIDELLVKLQAANVGCFVGNICVGALAYADDLTLLAPSTSAM